MLRRLPPSRADRQVAVSKSKIASGAWQSTCSQGTRVTRMTPANGGPTLRLASTAPCACLIARVRVTDSPRRRALRSRQLFPASLLGVARGELINNDTVFPLMQNYAGTLGRDANGTVCTGRQNESEMGHPSLMTRTHSWQPCTRWFSKMSRSRANACVRWKAAESL
jgi:hypothetical protein